MRNESQTRPSNQDYAVVFAKMDELGNVRIVQSTRQIAADVETIRLIAAATEEIERPVLTTFLSA